MCEGFNLRFKREYTEYLNHLKVLRWVGSLIYNSNVKKMHRKNPEQLLPLPELMEEKPIIIPTKEELKELWKWCLQ